MEHTTVTDDAGAAPATEGQESPTPSVPGGHGPSIEAILLTADRPVPAGRLAEALGLAVPTEESGEPGEPPVAETRTRRRGKHRGAQGDNPADQIASAVAELNRQYEATGRAFRIEAVAGGYRVMTLPGLAPVLAAFHRTRASSRLSRAAVETLAVIAYKQPITRSHLEAIRGVSCGEVLRSLLDRRLITIRGRAEELGRPILYGTTKEFLDAFGLASLKDLPSATELQLNP
jgi:segregation and condensation protein B